MKILHVNSERSWRGGEQQMTSLAEILRDKGHESGFFCRSGSETTKFAQEMEFPCFQSPFRGLKIRDALKLKKIAHGYDIVHTHTANAHRVAYYASILGMKTPVVVSKRTDFLVKSPSKFNHKNIKKILCVSNKITEITKIGVQRPMRVHTVYSGIDTQRFEGEQKDIRDLLSLTKDKILVGNCSALAPHKDYFTFIDVAKNHPDKAFVIIGDGPLEQELKDYASNISNVFFTGFLKNIQMYLKSLDYFLMTSETEGLGTSLLDSMICKVPIVATKAGGIPEIVIHQKTGLTADIRDVDQLSHNLKILHEDPELKQDIIENAYRNVKENFSREATAGQTLAHYKEL